MEKGNIILNERINQLLKIVYRNGSERYILNGLIYDGKGDIVHSLDYYNIELKDSLGFEEFDIMKIMLCNNTLLWERPREIPKLTPDERVILRNIPKEYKYIARDKLGALYVYTDKPDKHILFWKLPLDFNGFSRPFTIFDDLFQFIKWEDENPYLISDLLEG